MLPCHEKALVEFRAAVERKHAEPALVQTPEADMANRNPQSWGTNEGARHPDPSDRPSETTDMYGIENIRHAVMITEPKTAEELSARLEIRRNAYDQGYRAGWHEAISVFVKRVNDLAGDVELPDAK